MRYLCFILCAVIWVVNGEECFDNVDFCDTIVEDGTCYLYVSKVHCRKSCNQCNVSIPQAPPIQDPSCNDTNPYCERSFYVCSQYPEWVHVCMRTCELCVQTTVPSPKGTRTAQTTTSPREEPTATPEQEGRTTPSSREEPTTTPEEEGPTTEPEEEVPTTQPTRTKPPGTAKAVSCRNVHNQKFTPENRKVVVDKHNELRSALVKGNVRDARGVRLDGGRNIYELRWDCRLEEVAQKWANTCKYGHSTYEYRNKAGENIYMYSKSDQHESIDTNTLKAIQLWWDEIKLINMTSAEDYIINDKILGVAGHWSQQAWGATTKIGCGIANCTDPQWYSTYLVCHYSVAGNYFNRKIYQFGNGCTQDLDCTTYTNSTCNTSSKLCIQPSKQQPLRNPPTSGSGRTRRW